MSCVAFKLIKNNERNFLKAYFKQALELKLKKVSPLDDLKICETNVDILKLSDNFWLKLVKK